MKTFILLAATTFSYVAANAQYENMMKRKPWEETKLKLLLRDTLSKITAAHSYKYSVPQQTKNGVAQIPISGIYLGDNGKGDEIYAMQPDNMPCLVPGKSFTSNMPVAGTESLDKSALPLLQKDPKKAGE